MVPASEQYTAHASGTFSTEAFSPLKIRMANLPREFAEILTMRKYVKRCARSPVQFMPDKDVEVGMLE